MTPSEILRRTTARLPPGVAHAGAGAVRAASVPQRAVRYVADWRRYRGLPGAERLRLRHAFPRIDDARATSAYDSHYFFQDIWAARHIAFRRPDRHVDVGSRVDFVGFLTAVTRVSFVDIRPLEVDVPDFEPIAGSLLALPFADRSLESVSCLHVAEHVGLGRYGDPLDPAGTRKAAAELQRVVAPGGELLFSLPVGRERVEFNAHRVHDPRRVRGLFDELELVEFSGVDDAGRFRRDRSLDELAGQRYACGMFRLRRPTD
jgi:SAM-dependent methyltransferase